MLNNNLNKLRKLCFDECTLLKDLHTYLFVLFQKNWLYVVDATFKMQQT